MADPDFFDIVGTESLSGDDIVNKQFVDAARDDGNNIFFCRVCKRVVGEELENDPESENEAECQHANCPYDVDETGCVHYTRDSPP